MKKFILLFSIVSIIQVNAMSQELQRKKFISEIGFGINGGILGKGDYNGLMNEFSIRTKFKNSGIHLSMNYLYSSNKGIDNQIWGFNDSGHSTTIVYSRLNYFITPISFERLNFDIGAGILGGYVSDVYVGYYGYDNSSSLHYNISRYDCSWEIGYNLLLNLTYLINKEIGISASAGFDVLGLENSYAFLGLKISYKIN